MPKLISIKRPFAKKTKHVKDTATQNIAIGWKNTESELTDLAKIASEIKRIYKSSDFEKYDDLREKYDKKTYTDKEYDEFFKIRNKLKPKLAQLKKSFTDLMKNSTFIKFIAKDNIIDIFEKNDKDELDKM